LIARQKPTPETLGHVRTYILAEIAELAASPAFVDAMPGYLLRDQASQACVSILLERLKQIASI
jgi:hypothetical protein